MQSFQLRFVVFYIQSRLCCCTFVAEQEKPDERKQDGSFTCLREKPESSTNSLIDETPEPPVVGVFNRRKKSASSSSDDGEHRPAHAERDEATVQKKKRARRQAIGFPGSSDTHASEGSESASHSPSSSVSDEREPPDTTAAPGELRAFLPESEGEIRPQVMH